VTSRIRTSGTRATIWTVATLLLTATVLSGCGSDDAATPSSIPPPPGDTSPQVVAPEGSGVEVDRDGVVDPEEVCVVITVDQAGEALGRPALPPVPEVDGPPSCSWVQQYEQSPDLVDLDTVAIVADPGAVEFNRAVASSGGVEEVAGLGDAAVFLRSETYAGPTLLVRQGDDATAFVLYSSSLSQDQVRSNLERFAQQALAAA